MTTALDAGAQLHAYKTEAERLGYLLVAGVDADDLHGIARLIPNTPHTLAACHHAGDGVGLYAECPFMGDDAKLLAVLHAVGAALELARSID